MSSMGVPGLKIALTPDFFQEIEILLRNDAANQKKHIIHLVLLQQIRDAWNDGVVSAGENGQDQSHPHLPAMPS